MPSNKKLLQAAAGSAGGDPLYVEDVFSTFLYSGTDATQVITNGVDMTEGGLVWCKTRATDSNNVLVDSEYSMNTANKNYLVSNTLGAGLTGPAINSFNSTGFTLSSNWYANYAGYGTYASWSFRKAPKFFDVVTYTGNATSGRTIAHSLGSTPGMMIVKQTSGAYNWQIYHSGFGATKFLEFNTGATQTSTAIWNDTAPTDSVFTVGNEYGVNRSGYTYVAYLFASDAGGYGDDGTENIIKCGSYTTDGSGNATVNLGFEPQWILSKRINATGAWYIRDVMRGMPVDGDNRFLFPNTSGAENESSFALRPSSTGFTAFNDAASQTNVYMAIRRPMKTPEAGTEVFAPVGATTTAPLWKSSFPVDMGWYRYIIGTSAGTYLGSRLTGTGRLQSSSTAAEATDGSFKWDYMNGWFDNSFNDTNYVGYNFKRAAGFMDVVCYTGTGSATSFNHGLGVIPLLQIIKRRNATGSWYVNAYDLSPTSRGFLNAGNQFATSGTEWSGSNATTFSVYSGGLANINISGATYVNYLFATVAGVSKVGEPTQVQVQT